MAIDEKGQVLVYGSGTKYPAMHLKSIHGSGVNLVLDHAVGNIAVPDNKSMYFGHWASGTSIFTPRMSLGSTGKVGVGTTNALNSLHVRSSGSALRFDSKIASNDLANALIYKYKTGTTDYSENDITLGAPRRHHRTYYDTLSKTKINIDGLPGAAAFFKVGLW